MSVPMSVDAPPLHQAFAENAIYIVFSCLQNDFDPIRSFLNVGCKLVTDPNNDALHPCSLTVQCQ